ncbi:potassium-transporting ATPase subunit C [Gammaproteobacteria bacterium SCGC AG-212-F23]|nr:potassium-transporting ATPase subunit C [Gammaproteobacteria bacterium SCGC AG-212-F23]
MSNILQMIKTALLLLILMTLFTGVIYPGVVTLLAQTFFPKQANGSLLYLNNQKIGSKLIGQLFTDPKYFWGRPSATPHFPYNALSSSGSNIATASTLFLTIVKKRIDTLKQADHETQLPIPLDLVTASGSGLDPHITSYAAFFQVHRIAKARHISEQKILSLVQDQIKKHKVILGESRINVLELNLKLDEVK